MDISSLTGGGKAPEKEQAPALEYTAQVASPLVNGEVRLVVGEDRLAVSALFDAADIPYADMTALEMADYTVIVQTQSGSFVFSRMGSWCQPFYDALLEAYNKKVLKALFVNDKPILTTSGQFRYVEDGIVVTGAAPMQLHENCVCILPPNLAARRIPLCFLAGMEKGSHELTLRLDSGDKYTFAKLGYDADPFALAVEKQLRALREKSLASVQEIDPSLTTAQASAIAKLMPEGVAAPMGRLGEIAPSFVAAIEGKIGDSRASDSYQTFRELCDSAQIYVGLKKNVARGGKSDGAQAHGSFAGMLGGLAKERNAPSTMDSVVDGASAEGAASQPGPYMLWMIVPSPNGTACAVEFAGETGDAAATFVYRFGGGFDGFARKLNRTLEAINFKREVVRLTDEELQKQDNADHRIAIQRNHALQFVRSCFVGRVIHSNTDAWKKNLLQQLR